MVQSIPTPKPEPKFYSIGYGCAVSPESSWLTDIPQPPPHLKLDSAKASHVAKKLADREVRMPFSPVVGQITGICTVDHLGVAVDNSSVDRSSVWKVLKTVEQMTDRGFVLGFRIDRFIEVLTLQVMKCPEVTPGYSPTAFRRKLMEKCVDPYTYVLRLKEYRDYVSIPKLMTWMGLEAGDHTTQEGRAAAAYRLGRAVGIINPNFVMGNYEHYERPEYAED